MRPESSDDYKAVDRGRKPRAKSKTCGRSVSQSATVGTKGQSTSRPTGKAGKGSADDALDQAKFETLFKDYMKEFYPKNEDGVWGSLGCVPGQERVELFCRYGNDEWRHEARYVKAQSLRVNG
ncbi:hypothetical protein M427DRAFT_239087 [Gonapodya prolifera JEL478]|uniref:Uncharacterized protein n=1 Tax=Gonapodya prolifera (strain JEL478) TaxID=1344416 RepID=A0A138ZXY3_GONPJ|nr:hypothetical protein M427DRAFT_239087 [Gonapodya prolifera JEL478]|eukprot:KXS09359.1 hypothetical protein M427DRAFT_239087 [Gonapodya prolifera JEL478]